MAILIGGAGNDTLVSLSSFLGLEADLIAGGDGDDTLRSFGNNDILDGGLGNDFLFAGSGNDSLEGGGGNDDLRGGSGNDWVNAGPGDDQVLGDIGNDTYIGGSGNDTILFFLLDEGSGSPEDNTYAPANIDLAMVTQNQGLLGVDIIYGFENVFGSFTNDRILGNAGANILNGSEGNDIIMGRAGNDKLTGSPGADVLTGGLGADVIETNFGTFTDGVRDRVDYNALSESGVALAARDVISDFDLGGKATNDKIDLSTIDANPFLAGNQAFKFVASFGALVGEVRCVTSGGDTVVLIDADKDSGAEMSILVDDVTGLQAFDFIL